MRVTTGRVRSSETDVGPSRTLHSEARGQSSSAPRRPRPRRPPRASIAPPPHRESILRSRVSFFTLGSTPSLVQTPQCNAVHAKPVSTRPLKVNSAPMMNSTCALPFYEVVMKASGNRHGICPGRLVTTYMDRHGDRHFRRRGCLAPITGVTAGLGVKTMTISVQRLVVTAALLLVGVAASGRAQGIETVTNVPFGFTAGDTNLPRTIPRLTDARSERCVHDPRRATWRGAHQRDRSPERSRSRAETDLSSLQRSVLPP